MSLRRLALRPVDTARRQRPQGEADQPAPLAAPQAVVARAGLAPCLRLASALLVLLVLAAALVDGTLYARALERQTIHALAPHRFDQKDRGVALQAEAFRQPDLLPLYGASELGYGGESNPRLIFESYPTGFNVFVVGNGGETAIIYLQALAAVGPELQGKKVAITFTPDEFIRDVPESYYVGNFSRLHAYAAVFDPRLSFGLKQQIARRMLDYPVTLKGDPLLAFSLQRLIGGSLVDQALYLAAVPLGQLQLAVLRAQDHWATYWELESRITILGEPRRVPARLDWAALRAQAEQSARERAGDNPFGFEAHYWHRVAPEIRRQKERPRDDAFAARLEATGFSDLELLLQALNAWQARPLLLVPPLPGAYYTYLGVSPESRARFYQRLADLGQRYGVEIDSFADHDQDRYFVEDRSGHPSPKGWIYLDEALDRFFHRPAG